MPKPHIFSAFIFVMLFGLTACGYHLRGSIDLSEKLARVAMQSASIDLQNAMKQLLQGSGATLVAKPSAATLVIQLQQEDMQRRVLSLDSTGRANEFELTYRLRYRLLNAKGKPLVDKPLVAELHRTYFNNQIDILAKNNEERVIRQELYRQAAERILAQAQAVLK